MLEYENVPGAMVHRGFKGAYDFISKSIRQNVKDLIKDHPTAKILVTGHSLGGSLALLGAVDLKRELGSIKNQIQIYTFGAPRVGNIEFADYVSHLFADVNYIRVTHYDDAIPHIPWTSQEYRHVGTEVWYYNEEPKNFNYKECEHPTSAEKENQRCANSIWIKAGVTAHSWYMNFEVSNNCDIRQPNNLLRTQILINQYNLNH